MLMPLNVVRFIIIYPVLFALNFDLHTNTNLKKRELQCRCTRNQILLRQEQSGPQASIQWQILSESARPRRRKCRKKTQNRALVAGLKQ